MAIFKKLKFYKFCRIENVSNHIISLFQMNLDRFKIEVYKYQIFKKKILK